MHPEQAAIYPDASYFCRDCDSWFRREEIPIKDPKFINDRLQFDYYCNCGGVVQDMHELFGITPYDEKKLERPKRKRIELLKELHEVDENIKNIEG